MADTRGQAAPGEAVGWRALVDPVGLVAAAVFFATALTPSLVPRDPFLQGVLGGLLAAIGYEIGGLLGLLWRFLELPGPPRRWRPGLWSASVVAAVAIAAYGLSMAAHWQNATRRAFELPPVDGTHPSTVSGIALAVLVALWALFRLFGIIRRRIGRAASRVIPRRIGAAVGFALALWLFWALIDGVLLRRLFEAADASFEAADAFLEPSLPPPAEPLRAGSAASLLDWEELGRWGRYFVATAPTREEIAAFAGPAAMDPVRVYVGRRAAETPQERAELALAELIRAGGFERAALVVVVPVGTGWMDPGAHDTLDFMLGGDVATVAVQYSYLTSVLSLLAHPAYGVDQARALFDVVYRHWTRLPEAERPRLYVHGLSQGAFNSQATLPLLDMLADPIDGALWAGSPFFSDYWRHVREHRKKGSPAWRPAFGNGSLARSVNQFGGLEGDFAPWGPVRLVFLNYGSDPIVVFNPASAWAPPDWMAAPRAPDVAPELGWFPVVTTFQLALDMAISLDVAGFGHAYIARDYIDAWAAVTDPPGWTPARADALKAIFATRPGPFD
jgi:uncharacterized membrane protein